MKYLFLAFALLQLCFVLPCNAKDAATILTGKVNATVTRGAPLPFDSIVDEVLVKPGQPVEKGAPLIRYHLQDAAERTLIKELTTGANTEDIKSQVLTLERELANASAERNKTRQLVSTGLGSKQALSRLEDSVTSLKDRIRLLKDIIAKNESNFNIRLKELGEYFGKPINTKEKLPQELILTSPIKGYILSIDPSVNPDQLLAAGSLPVTIGQMDSVIIRVPVYETDLNNIKVGDTATIEIPSLNNREFAGIVTEISWISTDMSVANPSYYMVEITVPNSDLLMKPGFKAIAKFKGV